MKLQSCSLLTNSYVYWTVAYNESLQTIKIEINIMQYNFLFIF